MMDTHTNTIDILVTHLLQCSCNGAIKNAQCDDTTLVRKTPLLQQPSFTSFQIPDAWNSILSKILISQCSTVITIPRPFTTSATWREMNYNRKVLAPLPLQNCDNNLISTSFSGMQMSKKLPPLNCFDTFLNLPLETNNNNPVRECTVILRRVSARNLYIEYKCLNTRSTVKLLDVFKEIPQTKQEDKPLDQASFMLSLNLFGNSDTTSQPQTEIKTSHPIKLVNYHQIPFSSDYGRRLMLKDRHFVSEDVVLRKLERVEWYLNTTQHPRRSQPLHLDVSFDKRTRNYHRFKFPKRQLYQNHQSVKVGFLSSICRPVCVKVARMDLNAAIKAIKETQAQAQTIELEVQSLSVAEAENIFKEFTPISVKLEEINQNHLDIGIDSEHEHIISNNSDIVSEETLEKPDLFCSCGEKLILTSLQECTKQKQPIIGRKKHKNSVIRRSLRLTSNNKFI